MGKREKKTGKGRLDKYYKLAKEQGYRARSAFKLIQLNKRYQFLESARCCIDLCAAPGGWLQVASKWMPPNSLILGVDLVPIKPIPRVVTAAEDIRTERCRRWLRSELKDWKADVVLHDGAPNVGTAWVQDAFSQSELVLHSLKLATEMLAHGGYFITKVFRSKDYHSLLYVFNQLFKTVEATKPPSSRNVSAEIFVVCQGYLAPNKIDPRLLDPAHVFKDLDISKSVSNDQTEAGSSKLTPNAQNVFKPEKKRRMRDGYEEGDYILHKTATAREFIHTNDPISILGVVNTITFDKSEEDSAIFKLKATNSEIRSNLKDLKVLGKGDFKRILKWRLAVRELLGLDQKDEPEEAQGKSEVAEPVDENTLMEQELQRLQRENELKKKRERRRLNEKRTRDVQRMQLQMTTPMDIGLERTDDEVFDLKNLDNHDLSSESGMEDLNGSEDTDEDDATSEDGDESDEEDLSDKERKLQALEESLGEAYNEYQENQLRKDAKQKAREEARRQKHAQEQEREWTGCAEKEDPQEDSDEDINSGDDIEVVRKKRAAFKNRKRDDEEDDDSDSDGEDVTEQAAQIMAARNRSSAQAHREVPSAAAKKILVDLKEPVIETDEVKKRATEMWFDQPVFKNLPGIKDTMNVKSFETEESRQDEGIKFEEDDIYMQSAGEESFEESEVSEDGEPDVWEENGSDEDEKNAAIIKERGLLTPQAMQLALSLVNREKTKDQLIDSGFRRDAFFDDKDDLPSWFLDDEMRHFREHVPITKEAVKILRDKMRALDARPIKKIAEAKGRKKLRAMRRLQKVQNKANALNETSDLTEKEKSMEIEKMMSKLNKNPKKKNDIKLVVAKGVNKGQKGRPRGIKGRYKMVDPRGKKELRAQKRQERKSKRSK